MKRALLVLGAESTGTRLLTELLIAGGCSGDHTHHQPFDEWKFGDEPLIVWRRSFPWSSDHLWPNIKLDLLKPLRSHGYEDFEAIVTVRSFWSLEKSQVQQKHVAAENEARENTRCAYEEIFKQLAELQMRWRMVTLESIVIYGERAARPLLKSLGLNENAELPPIDGNRDQRNYPTR